MKIGQPPSLPQNNQNLSPVVHSGPLDQINAAATGNQPSPRLTAVTHVTSTASMNEAPHSDHLSRLAEPLASNLLDKEVLEPLLASSDQTERQQTLQLLEQQLVSAIKSTEKLHPRQGIMPLLLKSDDSKLQDIGVNTMVRYLQTPGKVEKPSLISPAYRTPSALQEAASKEWIKRDENEQHSTLQYRDYKNIYDESKHSPVLRDYALSKMAKARPDLHVKPEPISSTRVELTRGQQQALSFAYPAVLNELMQNKSIPLQDLRETLVKESFPLHEANSITSHADFVNMAKTFEDDYDQFNTDLKSAVFKDQKPSSQPTKQTLEYARDIALDKSHPQQSYATRYLAVASNTNSDFMFSCFSDKNKIPLDLTSLMLLKKLSVELEPKGTTNPNTKPFDKNLKQLISTMPTDHLISNLKDSQVQADLKPHFIDQLADNMIAGRFMISQGSNASAALDLGDHYPELKEPSLTFVKNRLEEFAEIGDLSPARSIAQNPQHAICEYAKAIVDKYS